MINFEVRFSLCLANQFIKNSLPEGDDSASLLNLTFLFLRRNQMLANLFKSFLLTYLSERKYLFEVHITDSEINRYFIRLPCNHFFFRIIKNV